MKRMKQYRSFWSDYFNKMRGVTRSPRRVPFSEVIWSWIGAFLGILAVSYINAKIVNGTDLVMVIGSFGASAVLIYGAIHRYGWRHL